MTVTLPSVHLSLPTMDLGSPDFFVLLLVGLVAGLLASRTVGFGGGLLIDMVVGIVGAFVGRWVFGLFNVSLGPGLIPQIVVAFVGAVLLLIIVRALTGSLGTRHRAVR